MQSRKKIKHGILRDDLPDLLTWLGLCAAGKPTLCSIGTKPIIFLAVEGVGLGEELPDENDIKVFLVSSNTAVYRF